MFNNRNWIRLATIALLLVSIVVPAIAADTDYWAPWVTALTTNSATVNWRGEDAGLGSVEYATSSYYEEHRSFQNTVASETTGAYQHVPLAGLEPDTSYVYKVNPPDNPGVFSNRTFRTMPVSGPFTFIVISDTHAQEKRFKSVADAIAKYETDVLFILDGGDYTSWDWEPYWSVYFQDAAGMLAKFPLFHSIGNHEYHVYGGADVQPPPADQYHWAFDVPSGGALNYSFDCSDVRFVVLNSPDPSNFGHDQDPTLAHTESQVPWLEKQLNNTMTGTFTIHHHPIWHYGRTTINPNLGPWETLYHKYAISANFSGHYHSYQKYSVMGIPYFIVANAGGGFIDLNPNSPRPVWYQYAATRQLGYFKVKVDPEHNTATAQEIFVAYVETNDSENPILYDPPIIADTVTFPLSSTLSTLTVTKSGLGTGTVSSSPPGIFCGPACSTCTANFKKVETVVLTATPAKGSVFIGWTGDFRGQGKCTVTMRPGEDLTVGAVFEKSSSTVPGKPTNVKAVRGNGRATVSFTAPEDGGSPITSYAVTSDPEGITVMRGGSSSSPITVPGLTYNISYTFTVTAVNIHGSGAPSDPSAPVTPTAAVPGAPTAVTAARNGNQSLNVSFTAPSANGAEITGYTVTSRSGGITATGTASPITVTGLENGMAYTFKVAATNGIGTGHASAWSPYVTAAIAPGAPTNVTATPGKLQATIAFNAPASNGGMPVTSYTLTSVAPAGITVTKASSPIIVTGLSNIEYTFNLTANNVVGPGASSSVSVKPAATKPGAPTGVNASTGAGTAGGTAFVFFIPPESDGGTAILGYTATSHPGGITATGTASPITVTGLTNGTAYTFKVAATNGIGTGHASAWSPYVTPATVPFAPKIGTAIKGNGRATVYFTAPAAVGGVPGNGGSPITSYTVTSDPESIKVTRAGSSSEPITVTGLSGGTPYKFTVTATNVIGESGPSSASNAVTPTAAIPGAPTEVTAISKDGQATVSFTAPLENGSPIQFYTATSYPGGITATGTASPITVSGLENGTAYSFRVTATNGIGTGHNSKASNKITPSTVPGKPTNVQAVRGNGQATVSFAAPVDVGGVPGNGGSPITSYTVSLNGVISFTKASSPIIVTGLENGTEYTFKVWANNKNGKGAEEKSNHVTPATLPGVPVINGTEDGNTQVTVLFTAPVIDGGSPITKYTVTSSPGGKTATAASSPITVTGLTNGTAYTFTVKATNSVGTGPVSAPSGKAIPGAAGWAIGDDISGTAMISGLLITGMVTQE